MSLFGNILWLIFGGLFSGIGHVLAGIALCLTIVGIPFGFQEIKIGLATLAPFGMEPVTDEHADTPLLIVLNIIWLVVWGWVLALHHLFWTLLLGITIIGIPFALQHLKLIPLSLWPFGRDLAPAHH